VPQQSNFPLVIAIDIGHTRTHVGLSDPSRLTCISRIDFLTADLFRLLPRVLKELLKRIPAGSDLPIKIAGRKNTDAAAVTKMMKLAGAGSIAWVAYHAKLPVSFTYKNPEKLGADRIADALYAAAAYPGKNCIVIDSGTAITIDCINQSGRFLGGVILAGVDLQLRGLHTSTRTLPHVPASRKRISLPGTSTETCVLAGTLHGIAGGLNHIVHEYKKLLGTTCVILATGGAWPITKDVVNFKSRAIPDLTLIGTALYK